MRVYLGRTDSERPSLTVRRPSYRLVTYMKKENGKIQLSHSVLFSASWLTVVT